MGQYIKRYLTIFFVLFLFVDFSAVSLFGSPLQNDKEKNLEQCTAIVADRSSTSNGRVLIAKNKDLSPNDCQVLDMKKREGHPANSKVRCEYIEIPQVPITYGWMGMKLPSQWGVGMGVNEHGVVITINAVESKEKFVDSEGGLSTPDVCRLGLERAKNVREAVKVMGGLIERYGQRVEDSPAITGQIYIIADPKESWILESTVYHWCAIKVNGVDARANQFQITTDWNLASKDLVSYAIEQGWCKSKRDFNFALAYSKQWPVESSQIRWERATNLLEARKGSLKPSDFKEIMRDHYEGTKLYYYPPHKSPHRTICVDRTGSSMVVELRKDFPELSVVWIALSSPCTSVYIPFWLPTGEVPRELVSGGSDSAWWLFENLQREIDKDYQGRHQATRAKFDKIEKRWMREIPKIEKKVSELNRMNRESEALSLLDKFNRWCILEATNVANTLNEQFERSNTKS